MKFWGIISGCAFLLSSCANKEEQWLQLYAQTKCAYQTEKEKQKADSATKMPALISDKEVLQAQLSEITTPFKAKLEKLNFAIKAVESDYLKTYRKLQAKQSEKHGHVSTPDYERKLSILQSSRDSQMEVLQKQISEVKLEMENSANYKSLIEKLKQQEEKIQVVYSEITAAHKAKLDSLQEVLDVSNSNFKKMKRELTPTDQKEFEQKRDSIQGNQCK